MIRLSRQYAPLPKTKPSTPMQEKGTYGHKQIRMRLRGIGGKGKDRYGLRQMAIGETRLVLCAADEVSDQQRSLHGTSRYHNARLRVEVYNEKGKHGVWYTLVGRRTNHDVERKSLSVAGHGQQ